MTVRVRTSSEGYAIDGPWEGCAAANAFLVHLVGRGFSAATVRAYAFDVLNLARFLLDRDLAVAAVTAVEVFEWIEGRRYLGLDVLARSRTDTPTDSVTEDTEEVTPALTA